MHTARRAGPSIRERLDYCCAARSDFIAEGWGSWFGKRWLAETYNFYVVVPLNYQALQLIAEDLSTGL